MPSFALGIAQRIIHSCSIRDATDGLPEFLPSRSEIHGVEEIMPGEPEASGEMQPEALKESRLMEAKKWLEGPKMDPDYRQRHKNTDEWQAGLKQWETSVEERYIKEGAGSVLPEEKQVFGQFTFSKEVFFHEHQRQPNSEDIQKIGEGQLEMVKKMKEKGIERSGSFADEVRKMAPGKAADDEMKKMGF